MNEQEVEARATELMGELNRQLPSSAYTVFALVTTKGPIFSWQTHKLKNLRGVEREGEEGLLGFIRMRNGHERLDIMVKPIPHPDENGEDSEETMNRIDLLKSIVELDEIFDCGPGRADEKEEFEFPQLCLTCGHVLPEVAAPKEEDLFS